MPVPDDGQELVQAVGAELVSRTVEVPRTSVRAFLRDRAAPRVVWMTPDEPAVAAAGAAVTVTAAGEGRFDAIQDAAADVFAARDVSRSVPHAARPRLFGGLAFHADHADEPPWEGFPAARFVLPRVQLTRTGDGATLTVNAYGPDADPAAVEAELARVADELADAPDATGADPPGIASIDRVPSGDDWRAGVETALDRIEAGTLRKVVLAQSLRATLDRPIDPPGVLDRLSERYPDCYRFLIAPTDAATVFGATPERLVSVRGRTVETEALAGSIGRGDTPAEDEALARSLTESEKDQHEHALVVDTIREQLDPFAASLSTASQRVRRLASVQHLETPIRARLAEDRHVLSLVEALHPTPAVGGLPPGAAQETIREAESFERGWYASPVGWFDARGNGQFAVAIRSAVAGDRTATLFAGAGIVGDSDPDTEWEEVQLKYRPVLDALTR